MATEDETQPSIEDEGRHDPDGGDPARPSDAAQPGSDADPPELTLAALLEKGDVHPLLRQALEAADGKVKEAEDRMLRAVAESQNERRRLAKEQADRIRFANESLLAELLPVLDNLELCIEHAGDDADVKNLRMGVEMTVTQFKQAVENVGAKPIEVQVGDSFDPKLHDAAMQDDEADLPARTVAKVVRGGFTYRDRILRPAKVVVATGKGLRN